MKLLRIWSGGGVKGGEISGRKWIYGGTEVQLKVALTPNLVL